MKITNKKIRTLIQESIAGLLESRRIKQQFYSKIRAKHPDIDKAFFVHWIANDTDQWEELDKRLRYMLTGTQFEYSANLVDPAGISTDPHYGDWGPIGIVFQGIATFGSMGDVGSYGSETPSGMRVYPGIIPVDKEMTTISGEPMNYYDDVNVDDPKDTEIDYLVKTNLAQIYPHGDEMGMDLSVPEPFLTHHPGFAYSGGEFLVIAKKVHAVVYLPDFDYLADQLDPQPGIADFKAKYGNQLAFAQGPADVSALYRSLYQKVK